MTSFYGRILPKTPTMKGHRTYVIGKNRNLDYTHDGASRKMVA